MADRTIQYDEGVLRLADFVKWTSADGRADFLELCRAARAATDGVSADDYASARMMQLFLVAAIEGGNEIIAERGMDATRALVTMADAVGVAIICAALSVSNGKLEAGAVDALVEMVRAGMVRCLDSAIGEAKGNG